MELKGYITNLADYNAGRLNGEWIEFPIDEDELEEVLERIGCADGTEYFFTDWESDILSPSDLGEYITPEEVNDIYDALEDWDDDALAAAIEAFGLSEVLEQDPYDVLLLPYAETDEDIGYYYAEETGLLYDAPEDLKIYFDYKAYGRDIRLSTRSAFTENGFIELF